MILPSQEKKKRKPQIKKIGLGLTHRDNILISLVSLFYERYRLLAAATAREKQLKIRTNVILTRQ